MVNRMQEKVNMLLLLSTIAHRSEHAAFPMSLAHAKRRIPLCAARDDVCPKKRQAILGHTAIFLVHCPRGRCQFGIEMSCLPCESDIHNLM